jgi:hypothetical protein
VTILIPIVLGTIALAFIALPVALIANIVVARNRQRSWTPATAKVTRVHMESRGTDDSRRSVMIGTYEYFDRNEQVHTGSGDLGRQGVAVDGSPQVVDILVDPLDPTRSQIAPTAGSGNPACGVVVAVLFGAIGVVALMVAIALLAGA